jgi:hypothetical protein
VFEEHEARPKAQSTAKQHSIFTEQKRLFPGLRLPFDPNKKTHLKNRVVDDL